MPARKATYRVKEGVVLYLDGIPYGEAQTVELGPEDGARYVAEGLVEAAES